MLWSERGFAQHKKGGAIRGADDASKTGHRGGGRSRVADIMPRENFGSWLPGISFLPEWNGMDGRSDAVPLRSA
jgi:hypothetical protein